MVDTIQRERTIVTSQSKRCNKDVKKEVRTGHGMEEEAKRGCMERKGGKETGGGSRMRAEVRAYGKQAKEV